MYPYFNNAAKARPEGQGVNAPLNKEGKTALAQLPLEAFNDEAKAHGQAVGFTKELYEALGAKNVVTRYRSAGAAGGKPFEEQLNAWKKRLNI